MTAIGSRHPVIQRALPILSTRNATDSIAVTVCPGLENTIVARSLVMTHPEARITNMPRQTAGEISSPRAMIVICNGITRIVPLLSTSSVRAGARAFLTKVRAPPTAGRYLLDHPGPREPVAERSSCELRSTGPTRIGRFVGETTAGETLPWHLPSCFSPSCSDGLFCRQLLARQPLMSPCPVTRRHEPARTPSSA